MSLKLAGFDEGLFTLVALVRCGLTAARRLTRHVGQQVLLQVAGPLKRLVTHLHIHNTHGSIINVLPCIILKVCTL